MIAEHPCRKSVHTVRLDPYDRSMLSTPCSIGEFSDQLHLCTVTRYWTCCLKPKELRYAMGPVAGYIFVSVVLVLVDSRERQGGPHPTSL